MAPATQVKLLRVLQERRFRRLGGRVEQEVDVRVIAATNVNPQLALRDGRLREDLYYRLNVFSIELPPLRDRKQDLPLLIQSFIEEFNVRDHRSVRALTPEAMRLLSDYDWPGNVRELRNVIERATILARGEYIEPEHLPPLGATRGAAAPAANAGRGARSGHDGGRGRAETHPRDAGGRGQQQDPRRRDAGHQPEDAAQQAEPDEGRRACRAGRASPGWCWPAWDRRGDVAGGAPLRVGLTSPRRNRERAARARAVAGHASVEVVERSIEDLQGEMAAGRTTARAIAAAHLARIAAYDKQGPALNAHDRPQSRARSTRPTRSTANDASAGRAGRCTAFPIVIKDNYETRRPADHGRFGGAGRASGPGATPFQVAKLRDAGAVILGKTNLHELAAGIITISSLGGQTRNPYDPARTPGGSSGGTAAAVAASFAVAGMASDTCGSIRIPAANNNLFGLRGTAGLSSRTGIIPLSHTQDIGGPLARTVTDLALMLDATVGEDPADAVTAGGRGRFTAHVPRRPGRRMRSRARGSASSRRCSARVPKTRRCRPSCARRSTR